MIYQVIQYVSQGGLPSPAQLIRLRQQGITHLLNVSGIDLYQLYPELQLTEFTLKQFCFKDVFSTANKIIPAEIHLIPLSDYELHTNIEERQQFLDAVRQLIEWLIHKTPCYIFCQQGIGRSSCVLSAALTYCYHPTLEELFKILKFLNPNAQLTCRSYSAITWFLQQSSEQN